MERVAGIGGVFFRARDPEALTEWYAAHLGVPPPPASYEESPWWQQAGPTVFAAMAADSPHFGVNGGNWALNFRVADLDAMIAQLTSAGVAVSGPESHPNGRFAELADPEGNPVQLWEPDEAATRQGVPD